jgi:hypothetical protein
MGKSNYWSGTFSGKQQQAGDQPTKIKKLDRTLMMENLEKSFSSKNFEAFTQIVANLTEEAAKQNDEAKQLLIYLKRQVNFGYQDITCETSKLSGGRYFTLEDFEKLAHIHSNQQIAAQEEHLLINGN